MVGLSLFTIKLMTNRSRYGATRFTSTACFTKHLLILEIRQSITKLKQKIMCEEQEIHPKVVNDEKFTKIVNSVKNHHSSQKSYFFRSMVDSTLTFPNYVHFLLKPSLRPVPIGYVGSEPICTNKLSAVNLYTH